MTNEIAIEPLGDHSRAAFCCGETKIDNFFRNNAKRAHREYGTRVFIARKDSDETPIGFYGLTVMTFDVGMNETADKKFSRHGQIPTVYLTMLARDSKRGPRGLGEILLTDALNRALRIREDVGIYAMTLHALNEKVRAIYEGAGFEAFSGTLPTEEGYVPMFIMLDKVAASLA
ncbi:MAG: hypothetical protein ACOH2J_22050 [Allorhizobium sp.]